MQKIAANSPEAQSTDLVAGNIALLKALFPELITEGREGRAINVDVLKALVGDATVTDADEKYGLNWHGKRQARQLALTPSTGTLRPCPGESVDWEHTQNIMIEGDNLEVLKLLQKSYASKIKLIYIDPPYNTGKDFVYPDNFQDSIKNYLEMTGQVEGGAKISTNTEAGGRFHTDWLNMMYPRLRLARNLLREDGVLFVSIDDREVENVKKLGVEIFGEECFVAVLSVLVNPRGRHLDKFFAQTHDNIVVFAKNADVEGTITGMAKEGAMLDEYDKEDSRGRYREIGLRNRNQAFNPVTRPTLYFPLYVNPETCQIALERSEQHSEEVWPDTPDGVKTCWTWSTTKIAADGDLLTAAQVADGSWRVFRKDYLAGESGEVATTLAKSIWLDKEFNNDYGRKSVKELFGAAVMDFPKSPFLLQQIVNIATRPSDIVLDFFAGSGTTGHAVMQQNSDDGGHRRYVLVQLPEPLSAANKEQSIAAEFCQRIGKPMTIAELTKERLRRAGKKIKEAAGESGLDVGFRVFKLDTSNLRAWSGQPVEVAQALLEHQENIIQGRTEQDLLYELLLKLGLDLCVPVQQKVIAEKAVHAVGAGVLLACLAESITVAEVETLAEGIIQWHQQLAPAGDTTCVFRDSAFADDVAKTNMAAILQQHGIQNVRSL
ncbi:MAG: site-specific DNA-methyltransferase [Pseudomonadota bacterium]